MRCLRGIACESTLGQMVSEAVEKEGMVCVEERRVDGRCGGGRRDGDGTDAAASHWPFLGMAVHYRGWTCEVEV